MEGVCENPWVHGTPWISSSLWCQSPMDPSVAGWFVGANLENVGRPQLEASDAHTHTHTKNTAIKNYGFLKESICHEMTTKIPLGEVDHPPWPKRAYQGRMNSAASLANMVIFKEWCDATVARFIPNCSIWYQNPAKNTSFTCEIGTHWTSQVVGIVQFQWVFRRLEDSQESRNIHESTCWRLLTLFTSNTKKTTINKSEQ